MVWTRTEWGWLDGSTLVINFGDGRRDSRARIRHILDDDAN
jgi:hypothetical protein